MFFKILPTIFLILAMTLYSWSIYLGGQTRLKKTILSQTREATSVKISWNELNDCGKLNVDSSIIAVYLADSLVELVSIPANPFYKYKGRGYIAFYKGNQKILSINYFTDNIIKINERYYMLSSDFFSKVRAVVEETTTSEVEQ